MNEDQIREKLHLYNSMQATPSIIMYGDSLWKRGLFGYKLMPLPGGREYNFEPTRPNIRARIGQVITVDTHGLSFEGIGTVAANLTTDDNMSLFDSLKLILSAEKNAAGIAFSNPDGHIMDWIGREDVPQV